MLQNLILAKAIDLIPDPIIAVDEQGRIVFTNEAHKNLTGWHLSEIKGQNYRLVYEILSDVNLLAEEKKNFKQEAILYKKDGSKLTLNVTCSALKHDGLPSVKLGQIIVFHPLFLQVEDMQKTSDDFVSTVSHELRTPLTSIKGFAETLIKSKDKLKESDQKRFLQIIKEQADHLTRLVEDLLFVSRLDNHKLHLTIRELELKKHIDRVCEVLGNQAGGRIFIYDFQAKLPPVMADSDRLEQILNNLIGNAIKYSPDHSSITIKTQLEKKNKSRILISITDQGPGIGQEDQELIFTRFSRLDNPLTRQTKGTGLGLYITKSLISAMKGEVWLEKSDSTGSTFSFALPVK